MNIKQLTESLPFLIKAGLVPNLIGKHGVGKSSVVSQYAKDNGYSFHPFFLGQMSDNGDLLGLPEFNRDSTGKALSVSFIHPEKLPKKSRSVLFFDELNRASKELLQAIFQLALEGTLHDYTLPEDSFIIMAMNPATDDYAVLDFADKAFADRFCHINFEPSHEEFHNYMNAKYGKSKISDFLKQQSKLLEESDLQAFDLNFVKPSRRSWDRLQKLELTGISDSLLVECGMGIVGPAAMISYSSWRETQNKILEGVDIMDKYDTVRNEFLSYFKNLETNTTLENPRNDIVSSVCSSFGEELTKRLQDDSLTEQNAINCIKFLLDTPVENSYACLLPFRFNSKFSTNEFLKKHVLNNDELADRFIEAQKMKQEYKAKQIKHEDDIPF